MSRRTLHWPSLIAAVAVTTTCPDAALAASASITVNNLQLQTIDLTPGDGQTAEYSFLPDMTHTTASASVGSIGDPNVTKYVGDYRQSSGWMTPSSALAANPYSSAAVEVFQLPGTLHASCQTLDAINLSCDAGGVSEPNILSPFGIPLDNFSIAPHTAVRFTGHFAGSVTLSGLGCLENTSGFAACDQDGFGLFVGNNRSGVPWFDESLVLRGEPTGDPDATLSRSGSFSFDIVNDTGEAVAFPLTFGVWAQVVTPQGPPSPIPEPASLSLALLGLAFLCARNALRLPR